MKNYLYTVFLILIMTSAGFAQAIDGVISADEYPIEKDFEDMKLYARPEGENIAIGLWADSDGWIGAGFGAMRMDGAAMVMGLVDGGESELHELTARGHRVREADIKRVIEWEVKEEDGQTTLEFLYPLEEFVSNGSVEMIISFSRSDSMRRKHSFRTSLVLDLE